MVNYKKGMIKSYFNELEKDYTVQYVEEEQPLGTGGGLCLLKGQIDSTFFLSNCDILIDADFGDIYNHHKAQGNVITMVCAFKHFTVPYGVIELGEGGEIQAMREKPEMNFLTNTGVYVVEPEVIRDLEDGKKQGFTDIIDKYRAMGRRVGVYPISESSWMDMGQMEELEKMRRRQKEYQQIVDQSLQTFAKTIDAKDRYTNGHSIRVAWYSREIARRMGFSPEEQERIYSFLEDISVNVEIDEEGKVREKEK